MDKKTKILFAVTFVLFFAITMLFIFDKNEYQEPEKQIDTIYIYKDTIVNNYYKM